MKNKNTEKKNVCVCLFIIPSEVLYCFKYPKIILVNFLTIKNPSIIPVTWNPEYPPLAPLCECEIKIDHNTGIVNSVWVPLTSYRIYYMFQACETGPTVYRPYLRRRLESLTVYRYFLKFRLSYRNLIVFFRAYCTGTDGGLTQVFFPYLFALASYSFLKFTQSLPSQMSNGWHLISYFVVKLLIDAFGGKVSTLEEYREQIWKKGGKQGTKAKQIYLPSTKSEYFVLLPNDICCSLESFSAIALKTKKLWRKLCHS